MSIRQVFRSILWRVVRRLPEQAQREFAFREGERWRARKDPFYTPPQRDDWQDFFRRAFMAARFNAIDGDYAEFGCAGGRTFCLAYHESRRIGLDRKLWAFDSFQGLPEQKVAEDAHPAWVPGTMRTDLDRFHAILRRYGVPRTAYEVVPGYYEDTLTGKLADASLPGNIAIAYVDCDLYSSTMTVLRFLLPRLKHGMILAFDDYYCYSNTQASGERRALAEMLGDHSVWRLVPYIQYGWHGMSFIVESKRFDVARSATY